MMLSLFLSPPAHKELCDNLKQLFMLDQNFTTVILPSSKKLERGCCQEKLLLQYFRKEKHRGIIWQLVVDFFFSYFPVQTNNWQ